MFNVCCPISSWNLSIQPTPLNQTQKRETTGGSWLCYADIALLFPEISFYFIKVILEKTLESPLDCKEIQPVHPKGDQSWVIIGRTDAEAETPILWPPDAKSWLWKDPDAGEDWRWEEKGMTEEEMVGWHHWLGEHESEWTPGVGDGTGRPGVLRFMGSQRVGHDWATDLIWSDYYYQVLFKNLYFMACIYYIQRSFFLSIT